MESILLQIPLEVRKYIFQTILHNDCFVAPEDRSSFERETVVYKREHCNQYPCKLPPMYYPTLLQINKQVHAEVKGFIMHIRYKLDCLIDAYKIYPTWLSIPHLSSQVDIVEVTVRLAKKQREVDGWDSGCRCCNGGPGPMVWSLAALLLRFVERGPDFLSKKRNMKVGTILVNVLNTTKNCEDINLENKGYNGTIDAVKLQLMLKVEMGYLLAPKSSDRRALELFQIVKGKLDCVKLLFDGELVNEWNVKEGCQKDYY